MEEPTSPFPLATVEQALLDMSLEADTSFSWRKSEPEKSLAHGLGGQLSAMHSPTRMWPSCGSRQSGQVTTRRRHPWHPAEAAKLLSP